MNTNNLISRIDLLFNIKTFCSWRTFAILPALVLSLYPFMFNFSPDHWLIPLLGIMCFTMVLSTYYREDVGNRLNLKRGFNSKAVIDDLHNTITPVIVTQFGKSNPANQCQVSTVA